MVRLTNTNRPEPKMTTTVQTTESPAVQMKRRPRNCPIVDHRFHALSDSELHYIAKDAWEAAKNMRGVSAEAEYKYIDQINDVGSVLGYRARGGKRFVLVAA